MIPSEHLTLAVAAVGCVVAIVVGGVAIFAVAFVVERWQMRRRGAGAR